MKSLFYFFTSFTFFVNAQLINGKILSEESIKGLSYISIYADDNSYLATTDSVGNFSFYKPENINYIILDVVGYEIKNINLANKNLNDLTIILKEEIIALNEVSIFNKSKKKIKVGNSGATVHVDFNPITDTNRIREIAVRLSVKDSAQLDKVNLGFSKLPQSGKIAFRLRIYDEKEGKPNTIISNEDLFYEINQDDLDNNVFSISLKKNNIILKGTFYISVEVYNETEESIWFSAGFLGKNGYMRRNYKEWDKMPLKLSPFINAELLQQKK